MEEKNGCDHAAKVCNLLSNASTGSDLLTTELTPASKATCARLAPVCEV